MDRPNEFVHDLETGEVTEVPMSDADFAVWQANSALYASETLPQS